MWRLNAMSDNSIHLGRTTKRFSPPKSPTKHVCCCANFRTGSTTSSLRPSGVISANDEAKVALAAVQDQLQTYALVHHAVADAGAYQLHRRGRISPTTMPGNQSFKT
jgi:hypothetical protein